eukprot:Pgem_evm1s13135
MITRVSGDPSKTTSITDSFYINLINSIDKNINRFGYKKNDLIHSNKRPVQIASIKAAIPEVDDDPGQGLVPPEANDEFQRTA